MSFSPSELADATSGRWLGSPPRSDVARLSIDTRTLTKGDLFVALKGPRFDGHDFLKAAAEIGATAVLVHQDVDPKTLGLTKMLRVKDTLLALQDLARFSRRRSAAKVVGIAGSNGKTSTKEMVASILSLAGPTLSTRGNLNNHIGLPLTLCALTPEHRFAVIEMGTSHPGEMDLLVELTRADVGMVTNVGKDHVEFFKTPEGVLKENAVIIDQLPPTGCALINLDDPWTQRLSPPAGRRRVTYSTGERGDIQLPYFSVEGSCLHLALRYGQEPVSVRLNVPDALQRRNVMAAAAAAYALGISAKMLSEGLAAFKPAAMRLQASLLTNGSLLINDAYNANPTSMRASIESLPQSYPNRKYWVVIADMRELGPRAASEHRELGDWLRTQELERIFLYGRDTRFVAEALARRPGEARVERFKKKRYLIEALSQALASAQPVVLFKGSRSLKLENVIYALKGTGPTEKH